jgi:hypothetical protein
MTNYDTKGSNMLRKGSTGTSVGRWQMFLRGFDPYSEVVVTNTFDDVTDAETKAFQAANGLTVDGIVGPTTLAFAEKYNYTDKDDLNWPQNPGIKNLSFIDRQKLFGTFSFISAPIPGNPEAIRITSSWAVDNITTIIVPQLVGVDGAAKTGSIQVHKKIANQTAALFYAWENAGLKDKILSWGGSWVPRFIRGSRTSLSNHAWGTAFDINAQWNGLGAQPAKIDQKGCVRELVQIAADHGFYWGGWFPTRPDGMHFEAYKII